MAKTKRGLKRGGRPSDQKKLIALIEAHPEILPILDRYGISFCAGCYLTLAGTPAHAAAFHAVSDIPRFIQDLQKTIRRP